MPLFSIIIPLYNKALYIEQTLNSVLNQTYANWECIVVDDGSTDNSRQIIELIAAIEPRIKTIFKTNSGVADTRNIGLSAAVGDYVIFLDGDDFFASEKLSLTLEQFTTHPDADVAYSNYTFCTTTNIEIKPTFRIQLATNNVYLDLLTHWDEDLIVPIHCCCYKREILSANNIYFDVQLTNKEDWDFLLQVASHTNSFYFIKQTLVSYLIVEQSRSNVQDNSMLKGTDQLLCKHYNVDKPTIMRAIAYNLRYRIVRNRLIKLLGKKEPKVKLSFFDISKQRKIKSLSRQMIPYAITHSIYKLLKKI